MSDFIAAKYAFSRVAENFGMAMAASVLLAATTTAVMFAVQRLRVGSTGAF